MLVEGEKMVIDTTPGTKSVEFVGVNGARRDVINPYCFRKLVIIGI